MGTLLKTARLLLVLSLLAPASIAQTFDIVHSFTSLTNPQGALAPDTAGNFYGTTEFGGYGFGGIFRLSLNSDGTWTSAILHEFDPESNGANPMGGLIRDANGNLYGTTSIGGGFLAGVVYELSPNSTGPWTYTVLHRFAGGTQGVEGGTDGARPSGPLFLDSHGNLYGTTQLDGVGCLGIVYELTPNPDGTWTETILHAFGGPSGASPKAGVVVDADGNIYGTAAFGGGSGCGGSGCGVVFELTPKIGGGWNYQIIHNFTGGTDGEFPWGGLTLDSSGNLYGTTANGGSGCNLIGCGLVFELSPNRDGSWTENILYEFKNSGDGAEPLTGVTLDSAGNIYGTAGEVVFELTPSLGAWVEKVLHTFTVVGGSQAVIVDSAGNVYAGAGGASTGTYGFVYRIEP